MRLEVSQTRDNQRRSSAVAGVAEAVTVSAESPLLETSNANRGTVIDSPRIAELPLQSRSPWRLQPSSPGSTTTPRRSISARSTTVRSPTGR